MRFSSTAILALPLLASAVHQESPLDYYKEQAQIYFNKLSSYIPNIPSIPKGPGAYSASHAAHHAAGKVGGKTVTVLDIDNWKPVLASSGKPEEWWVQFSGGNKTCYGLCGPMETAFNETALAFAVVPGNPKLALVNCDQQPLLCNSWAAGPPELWIMQVGAAGAPTDIRIQRMNTTSTTPQTYVDLQASRSWEALPKYEGYFHPLDGPIAKYGLALPLAYFIWFFSVIPSWAFMIGVSFFSRTIMSRRAGGQRPAAAAPAAAQ